MLRQKPRSADELMRRRNRHAARDDQIEGWIAGVRFTLRVQERQFADVPELRGALAGAIERSRAELERLRLRQAAARAVVAGIDRRLAQLDPDIAPLLPNGRKGSA